MSSPDGGLVPIAFALLWVHSCRVSFDRAVLWTCGSLKGTQRDCVELCVCCLFIASRCGCRPASGMSTPSRCRASAHNQMSVALCPSCALWLCEFAIDDQSGRTTMVTPADRGGLGKAMLRPDRTPYVFVLVRLWVFAVRGFCTAWRHTPVMHDWTDPLPTPIVVPPPSLDHRRFFAVGLAR